MELTLMQDGNFTRSDIEGLDSDDVIDFYAAILDQRERRNDQIEQEKIEQEQWLARQTKQR